MEAESCSYDLSVYLFTFLPCKKKNPGGRRGWWSAVCCVALCGVWPGSASTLKVEREGERMSDLLGLLYFTLTLT